LLRRDGNAVALEGLHTSADFSIARRGASAMNRSRLSSRNGVGELMFREAKTKGATSGHRPSFASIAEIENAFDAESELLLWIAWLITGDQVLATRCVADARKLSCEKTGVFSDWLTQWARSATIQRAIEYSKDLISSASHQHENAQCTHGEHTPLTIGQIDNLRIMSLEVMIEELDAFTRAVMLLRSIQRCTIHDCALRLESTRSAIVAACCALEQWVHFPRDIQQRTAG
jgi:hypothetical protein